MKPEITRRIVRWAPWVLVAALVLFAALPVFYTVAPVGCVSCHESRGLISGVDVPTHAGTEASCQDCHIGKSASERLRFGFYQAYAMTIPVLHTRDSAVAGVSDAACKNCHSSLPEVVDVRGLRIKHEACAEGSACTDCHSTVAHEDGIRWPTTYHMDFCLRCHEVKKVSTSCDTCHTEGASSDRRPTTGPWAITHGPNWKTTHGMGSMSTCGACHPQDYCTRCHGAGVPHDSKFFDLHGATSLTREAQCDSCHQPKFCSDCHTLEMPHPESFTQGHSTLVREQGDASCTRCHAEQDCITCHVTHVHPGGAVSLGGDS